MKNYERAIELRKEQKLERQQLKALQMCDKILAFEQTLDTMISFKNISLETAETNIDGWNDLHEATYDFIEEYEDLCLPLYANDNKFEEMKCAFYDITDYFFTDLLPDIQDM